MDKLFMKPESAKLIFDIREAIQAINGFTENMNLDDYLLDEKTRAAVERKFEVIGEACTRLRERDPDLLAQIPSASQIIGFRNRLIHGYDHVDDAIVWDVITYKIPELEETLPEN